MTCSLSNNKSGDGQNALVVTQSMNQQTLKVSFSEDDKATIYDSSSNQLFTMTRNNQRKILMFDLRRRRKTSARATRMLVLLLVTALLGLAPVSLLPNSGWQGADAAPTFFLPWEAGSVWQVTHDSSAGHHADQYNDHAFDAVPVPGRSTNQVTAIAGGTVVGVQNNVPNEAIFNIEQGGHAGNCMMIRHDNGTISMYAHLAAGSIPGDLLQEGAEVRGGMVIGTVGDTGTAVGVHLHWSLLSDGFMYEDRGYLTCAGTSIPSQYADNDAELIEDGGVPRAGRYYESTNGDSGTVQAQPAPTQVQPAATEVPPAPTQVPPSDSTGQGSDTDEFYSLHIRANTEGAGTTFGAQFTVTTEDGEHLGMCTLEGDESSPPWQYCWVDVPTGIVVSVWQDPDTLPAGYAPVENPIVFDTTYPTTTPHQIDVAFKNVPQSGNTSAGQTSDVVTAPMDIGASGPNGQEIGARFTVTTVDGAHLGTCTLEGDAAAPYPLSCRIDVPRGTTVVVTLDEASITPGYAPVENPISFDTSSDPGAASHWGVSFQIELQSSTTSDGQAPIGTSDPARSTGAVDIALITRDPDTGSLLTDTCYVLVDFSNEGCDENGDGQVTFADIPFGAYTVRQTLTPAGYPTINEYEINVKPVQGVQGDPVSVPLGFIVRQAPEQNAPETRNVSVVLVDSSTNTRIPSGACFQIIGASNVGCDEDLRDGQIDFLDVPIGSWETTITGIPDGYTGTPFMNTSHLALYPEDPPNVTVYVWLDPQQGSDGSVPIEPAQSSSSSAPPVSAIISEPTEDLAFLFVPCGGPAEACLNATVAASTQDGEFISSCTFPATTMVAPFGCSVPNVPRGIVVSLTIDGIASGYVAEQNPVYWDTTKDTNQFMGEVPMFSLVPTDGTTSTNSAEATVLMTFRGCPEGFVPNVDDPYSACTVPLDAPDASTIVWGGDGQGGMNITGLERQYDGAYIYTAGPNTMNLQISGLAPVVRDSYQVFGADGGDGGVFTVNLVDGETREILVFYYFE